MEGERRQYKDAFVGVAEYLCGRTSGNGGTPTGMQKPRMVFEGSGGRSGKRGR